MLACCCPDKPVRTFTATYMNHVVTGLHRTDITGEVKRTKLDMIMLCQDATYGPAGALGSSGPLTSSFDISFVDCFLISAYVY